MKQFIFIFALIGINLFNLTTFAQLTEREKKVIDEINLVRTNPKSYIKYVDEYLASFKASTLEKKDAEELKKELGQMRPVVRLQFSEKLYNSSKKHAAYVIKTRKFEHSDCYCGENIQYGINDPRHAVIELLIDSGIKDRGHRKNILNPDYQYVAVYEIVDEIREMPNFFIQQFDLEP